MKQKSFLLSLLTMLLPLTAWATSFTVDGIRYNTTSAWEVEVINPEGGNYQGAVNIPASVTYEGYTYRVTGIGEEAIQGPGVTSLTLPAGTIRTIKRRGCYDLNKLTSLTIPASVTEIGKEAFMYCDGMEHLYFCSETPPNLGTDVFNKMKKTECKIHVPMGCVDAYRADAQFAAFSSVTAWESPEIYGIKVAGCLVTEENAADIFDNGSVIYVPATTTLTISKNITTTIAQQPVVYNESVEGLTIALDNCSLLATETFTLHLLKETTLTGTATIEGSSVNPIYCWAPLTIMNATLNYTGPSGILGSNSEDLQIKNSNVTGTAVGVSPITGFQDVILTDCYYQSPTGAHYDGMNLLDGNNSPVSAVTIKAGTPASYKLWVAGTQVTDQNCADILGNGAASFSVKDRTLSIYGDITATGDADGIKSEMQDLIILTVANATVSSENKHAISISAFSAITGPGELTLTAPHGYAITSSYGYNIQINEANIVLNNCSGGFDSSGELIINTSTITGSTTLSVFINFRDVVLTNCYYESPLGAHYSVRDLYDLSGNVATSVSILPGKEKSYADLSFPSELYITTLGKSFTPPTLNNPAGLQVEYSSSNTNVANINYVTGQPFIGGLGVTTISATYAGDANTYATRGSYLLVVTKNAGLKYDVNEDGVVSITDAVAVVNAILNGVSAAPKATPAPEAAPVEPEVVTSPE